MPVQALSGTDLVVHGLDELEFFFQSLTPVLGVYVLQRLVVQILTHVLAPVTDYLYSLDMKVYHKVLVTLRAS